MDHYELGIALAVAHLAELHPQADRRRLASRIPGRTARRHRDSPPGSPRVIGRQCHAAAGAPGRHPRSQPCCCTTTSLACSTPTSAAPAPARAGLLDHYHRVQHQEVRLRQAHRDAHWAPWSSAAALLLAAIALLSG